jgi:hypothetical protein
MRGARVSCVRRYCLKRWTPTDARRERLAGLPRHQLERAVRPARLAERRARHIEFCTYRCDPQRRRAAPKNADARRRADRRRLGQSRSVLRRRASAVEDRDRPRRDQARTLSAADSWPCQFAAMSRTEWCRLGRALLNPPCRLSPNADIAGRPRHVRLAPMRDINISLRCTVK